MPEQYVPYGTAWFTLSLINAVLAQSKGRGGLAWWLGSLVIGPVATFLIAVSPRVEPGAAPPEGRMTRQQAVVIGAVIVAALLGLLALGLLAR